MDKIQKLDYGERWLRDGLQACGNAGAFESVEVDATMASAVLERLKAEGVPVTFTHIFIRAAAMVLRRDPDLHQLVAGNSRIRPSSVDICLSIAGESSVTPVLVIEDAANKDLRAIAAEVVRRVPDAVDRTAGLLSGLRKFGWIVPLAAWRRGLVGFLLRRPWYKRKVSGTFQVSCMPQVDVFAPFLFNTVAALGVGRVADRVIAVNGRPAVRRTVRLSCCFDHAFWNGSDAARFLTALRDIVESGDFAAGLLPDAQTSAKPSVFTATAQ